MGRAGHRDLKSSASLSQTGGRHQMSYYIVEFLFYLCYCITAIFVDAQYLIKMIFREGLD